MTLTFQTHPIDLILLDIEGTISSQRYVLDVLYPFARERNPAFVARHPDHPVVQRALQETAERIEPGQDPVAALIAWQDADQKVPPLKLLQGLVWEEGYNEGAFKGHIYDDAHAALEGWHRAGVPMHIFSSGSVKAQVEFFQNSNRGDLRPYFGRHYDTDIGAKVVPELLSGDRRRSGRRTRPDPVPDRQSARGRGGTPGGRPRRPGDPRSVGEAERRRRADRGGVRPAARAGGVRLAWAWAGAGAGQAAARQAAERSPTSGSRPSPGCCAPSRAGLRRTGGRRSAAPAARDRRSKPPSGRRRRKRRVAGAPSEMPTTCSNTGRSRCQPMPAPGS